MDAATIIGLGLQLANQGIKAAEAAQAGNIADAERILREGRMHFDRALAAWNAAANG